MATMPLKGVNQVTKRLADGRRVTYWYAWKGGPRLNGEPGSDEFIRSLAEAAKLRTAVPADTLAGLVRRYRDAPEFKRLAQSTQAEWRRWLDRIETSTTGKLPIAALAERRVRVRLLAWRDTYADRPRAADYGAQVLGRVLGWAKGRGLIDVNHFEDIEQLHRSDRADMIWTDDELARFAGKASPEVARALRLACFTGLRRGDLIALRWEDVGETAIVISTRKTGGSATIPLLPDAKAVLAEIGRGKGEVLRNTFGNPWSADGLENRIIKAKTAAGIEKRLHDARGTFATRLRLAGVTRDEIAQIMGWRPDRVERILARYVDQAAFVRSIADRLAKGP